MMKKEHPKDAHIRICSGEDVTARGAARVFSSVRVIHKALPEIDLAEVNVSTKFLGRDIAAPLIINSMTGGTDRGARINRNLARAAQKERIPLFLGSGKSAIKDNESLKTFAVRKLCPDVPLFANLGLSGLGVDFELAHCKELVKRLEADGLVFYANPLHEALQPDGNTKFKGLLGKLRRACEDLDFPVIVKEVGFGIDAVTVIELLKIDNLAAVDIAGGGGTDWALVEMHGHKSNRARKICKAFEGWGATCAETLIELGGAAPGDKLIASGGIRNGVDVLKSMCLGAGAAGAAMPFLKAADKSAEKVSDVISRFVEELRVGMFCASAAEVSSLNADKVVIRS